MITLKQEGTIRKFLESDETDRQIARKVKVSPWVVRHLRDVRAIVKALPSETCNTIRSLLLAGLSSGAIEIDIKIPRKTILAVRRFYYLQPRKSSNKGFRKCPTCGSMMFGDPEDRPKRIRKRSSKVQLATISPENADALYRIACDLCDLNEMRVIPNPLLYYLARRAEKVLEEINGKSSSNR